MSAVVQEAPARPIRVLLVDDDPMVVRGLQLMLEAGSDGEISVVGTAGDGTEVVQAVRAHCPDVVLMDVRMPRKDGIAATREIVALPDAPAVVVLTTFDGEDEPIRAAHAGRLVAALSPREAQVASAVARGLTNREIASELYVSEGTVKAQLATVQDKLGVDNRVLVAVLLTQAG